METLEEKLRQFLQEKQVSYQKMQHAEATTCEDSARERGKDMAIGGKTLLFKSKKNFHLFTLSAVEKVDSNKVRKILKSDRLRFATEDELWQLTGALKGALPPFGEPLLPFDLHVDESVLKNSEMAFNAGVLTTSFILQTMDYLEVTNPRITNFARDPRQLP